MNRLSLILLMVGVVIGFLAGYFVGRRQNVAASPQPPAKSAVNPVGRLPMPQPGANQKEKMMEEVRGEINRLQDSLKGEPDNYQTLLSLGNLYFDIDQYSEAIKYYEKALEKDSSNLGVQVDLAVAYKYIKQIDKAIQGLTKVLETDPEHPQALYNMGIFMLHDKRDFPAARDYWTRLMKTGTNKIDLGLVNQRLQVIETMIQQQQKPQSNQESP